MFNRLPRCLTVVRKPLTSKLSRNVVSKPSITPVLSILNVSQLNFSSKKYFSSNDAIKTPDFETAESFIQNESPRARDDMVLQNIRESDPAMDKKYKILELELDVMRQSGKLVPQNLTSDQWIELLTQRSRSGRGRYLHYLFTIEKKQENLKRKKEIARIERENLKKIREESEDDLVEYGLRRTSMFMRIYDTTIHHFYHSRLIQAMMFGPKLIIDCGYFSKMTPRESKECSKQLAYMFSQNRLYRNPFNLYFCNVEKSSLMMRKFHRIIPTAYDDNFPLNIRESSYTEYFDKSKLIYLTPDCNNEMKEYDHDSIYIIGAIVDKATSEPLSLGTAKKEGLRMAKLPLDKYLLWGSGSSKRLPLNQMVNILHDLRITGDWKQALKHVPRRKLEKPIDQLDTNELNPKRRIDQNANNWGKNTVDQNPGSFSFQARQRRFSNK